MSRTLSIGLITSEQINRGEWASYRKAPLQKRNAIARNPGSEISETWDADRDGKVSKRNPNKVLFDERTNGRSASPWGTAMRARQLGQKEKQFR